MNNDGYSDLIVGAYGNSSDKGRHVYLGGTSMDDTPDVIMNGEFNGENFGSSASSAGDVNGDGFDDVIVGAYSFNGGIGRAFIFFWRLNYEQYSGCDNEW
ncbi:MAG: FG-GAP repeat protein [Ignavibacteria bacterium]|nr:FG-GAP repeat protein [Ignavibacteria bacterium]